MESLNKSPGEVIEVRQQRYVLTALLSHGNAEIWACTEQHGAQRVLKITSAEAVQEEVDARKAVGWEYHSRTMLQAFDYEGPCLVLERAERTLRQRIDVSAIDRVRCQLSTHGPALGRPAPTPFLAVPLYL